MKTHLVPTEGGSLFTNLLGRLTGGVIFSEDSLTYLYLSFLWPEELRQKVKVIWIDGNRAFCEVCEESQKYMSYFPNCREIRQLP